MKPIIEADEMDPDPNPSQPSSHHHLDLHNWWVYHFICTKLKRCLLTSDKYCIGVYSIDKLIVSSGVAVVFVDKQVWLMPFVLYEIIFRKVIF